MIYNIIIGILLFLIIYFNYVAHYRKKIIADTCEKVYRLRKRMKEMHGYNDDVLNEIMEDGNKTTK